MKIDPNTAVNNRQISVMVYQGKVELPTGVFVSEAELSSPGNNFESFCKSHDPNTCFILAYLPDRHDENLFFKARDVASKAGLHMQGTIERADIQHMRWDNYKIGYTK